MREFRGCYFFYVKGGKRSELGENQHLTQSTYDTRSVLIKPGIHLCYASTLTTAPSMLLLNPQHLIINVPRLQHWVIK